MKRLKNKGLSHEVTELQFSSSYLVYKYTIREKPSLHSHRGKGYAYALPLLGNATVQSTDQKNRDQKRLRKKKNGRRKEERVDSMKWNWEELANGIVLQAVKDYRASRRRARKRKTAREARMRIREVEMFFHSRWFCQLTDIDGEKLLEQLKEEPICEWRRI